MYAVVPNNALPFFCFEDNSESMFNAKPAYCGTEFYCCKRQIELSTDFLDVD